MTLIKTSSPITNLSEVQYKFSVDSEYEKFEENREKHRILNVDRSVYQKDNDVYAYNNPFCKHCFSRNLKEWQYNPKMLIDDDGNHHHIEVQRYYCNNCHRCSQTEFTGEYEPYCNFSNNTKEKAVLTTSLEQVSLRNLSSMFYIHNNISISHETARKSKSILNELYYVNKDVDFSGYCGYDEQWAKINSKWQYRFILFDLIKNTPIAEGLYDNMENKTIEDFIRSSIPSYQLKGLVTDGKEQYERLARNLKVDHQSCTFHLQKNIYEEINIHLNQKKREFQTKIKNKNPQASKKKIKEQLKIILKPIKEEINDCMIFFNKLFESLSYDDALEYIEKIKSKLPEFPSFLKNYLNQSFMPNYKKYLTYLKKPHIGRLTKTNNQTENYIGNTMPKADKNKYKTGIGFMNQIYNRSQRWGNSIKNN
jgi:hypothetical protein